MGYYTTYSLTLEEGPREQFQRMLEDIDAMMGDNEMSSFESINAKWYSYETDIKQLSLRSPDIIFRVNGDVDDEPLVSAFADKSALIERLHGEADLSAVYLYDLGFGPYLHSNGGCSAVTYVDMRAYGTLSFFETGLDGEDRSLLDKGYHHRCGERLHLATANVRSNIRRCHGRLLTTLYSRFYHNKQILFVSLSYEINKCVNL